MSQFHFDPQTYLEMMRAEVPDYERLQDELAAASAGRPVDRMLDLGAGTGQTARRVLAVHPRARLVALDENPGMLELARALVRDAAPTARFVVGRLEDPLPAGPFDLVISALAVHHLDAAGKADLFARIAVVLAPGGRFVLADVVVPTDPADLVTPVDGAHDQPSPLPDQLDWLRQAGLDPDVVWMRRDLAVVTADRPAA
ncbi:tRNA (cmo5U34)-methyltransferase [Frankia sp. AiPs1]|uniref:class I SAM-dependent methyltransferase n=1 Tax=Frankia sp. AiPa1 TaxID=573492 RepID=UPI00202B166B|nr:class I SAM-dependent methyltransferase [Frankia sp. AiPa1]MCL9761389.1 class I SAM-dependent methyltransferase [Frankia sp. AiPa1]